MLQTTLNNILLPAIVISSPTMAVQDDLAALFAQNLTLTQPQQPPSPPPSQDDKIVYVSQHYTHSAHIIPIQRPTSEPDLADIEHILRSFGVETSTLTLPQVELFRRADVAQKTRLVELWTISPNTLSVNNPSLTWSATSLEQEEMLARRRHKLLQQQHEQPPQAPEVDMSLDDTEVASFGNSPGSVQSTDNGRWAPPVVHAHTYMEPYMQSGYEELARREYGESERKAALDPVYKSTGGMLDWERQQWMENQYGSFVGGWRDDEEML